jgi:ribosomal RNA-processing protein 9
VGGIFRSDLCASGGSDGFVRLWKVEGFRIAEVAKIRLEGFVNGICFAGNRLVVAVGQEHRLGRWGRVRKVRNGIAVVSLPLNLHDQ